MKPFDIKESPYINFDAENNDKDHKFKIGDQVRISNHKNSFAKRCTSNSEKDVFVIKKVKKCCSVDISNRRQLVQKFLESFMKKNYKRRRKKILRLKRS